MQTMPLSLQQDYATMRMEELRAGAQPRRPHGTRRFKLAFRRH